MTQKLEPKTKDLGGFEVRRLLPQAPRRAVGPFVFFDHMGPATFAETHGMDVRPHPHIGLATVTYLFEGKIEHRDSLGNDCLIQPGAINWMVAGRGIVHSERTPGRERASRLHGLQLWVALPEAIEESAPSFTHHAEASLPEIAPDGVRGRLLLGRGFGAESPVRVHSPLVYAEFKMEAGQRLVLNEEYDELTVYGVQGALVLDGEATDPLRMTVLEKGRSTVIEAPGDAHFVVLGGNSVGPRFIDWNFVSSRPERLEEAKRLWAHGPRPGNPRFTPVVGDTGEFIPLTPPRGA